MIHRETCGNVEDYRKQPEKWLPVTWQHKPGRLFLAEIRIETVNRMGVLAAVSAAIAGTQTNVIHVTIEQRDAETSVLVFVLEVADRKHLARVMRVGAPHARCAARACAPSPSSAHGQRAWAQGDAATTMTVR